jgi:hypothetical protein
VVARPAAAGPRDETLNDLITRRRGSASRWLLIPLVLFPALHGQPGRVDVEAANGRLTVHAKEAPLADVLDRIAGQTGTKILYQGPRPSPLVTVAMENLSELEALSRLLEGLGLNHVFQMDASGTKVEMLIVDEAFGSGPSTARSRGQTPTRVFRRPMLPPGRVGEGGPDVVDPGEEAPEPDDGFLGPGALPDAAGLPATATGETPEAGSSEPPPAEVAPPEFPGEASTPSAPAPVPYPVFPPSASEP